MAVTLHEATGLWLDDDTRAWFDYVTDSDFDIDAYRLAEELDKSWPTD